MSTTIASASVRIGPDLTGFRAELEAEVQSALSTARAKVKVEADTAEAEGQLALFDAETTRLDGKTVDVKVKVDSSQAQQATRAAEQGIGGLATAIVTLGPALVPITASVVGFGVAAAGAFGAAALGAGVVALAYKQIKTEVSAELTPAIHQLQVTAAAGLGPAVKADVHELLQSLPQVRGLVAAVSTELGHLTREGGQALGGSGFRSFFDYIDKAAVPTIDELGHVLGNLVETGAHLVVAFAPVTAEIGAGLEHLTAGLASSTAHSADLEHFVAYIQTEGPQVVHVLADTGAALVHVGAALAPVGAVVLDLVRGLDAIVSHTPKPVIDALVIGFGAYAIATKAAALANKIFGVSEEEVAAKTVAATASTEASTAANTEAAASTGRFAGAVNPLTIAITAATIGFTAYTAAKQRDAEATREVLQYASDYVDSLHTVYTSQQSVADSTAKIRAEQQQLADTVGGKGVYATAVQAAKVKALGLQLDTLNTQSRQAQSNAQSLASQYGLTTSQVVKLAGGSDHLTGSLASVSKNFSASYKAAIASHSPLNEIRLDMAGISTNTNSASQQLQFFNDLLDRTAGSALSTDAAALSFKDDLAQLIGALQTSHGSLNANTTAGRAAAEALNSTATQALAVASATEKQTGSAAKARAILQEEIRSLEQAAGGSKAARQEIDLLKNALDHIPQSGKSAAQGFQANAGQIAKNAAQASGEATISLKKSTPDAKTAGGQFAGGYAAGIAGGQDAVVTAAANLAASAVDAVKKKQVSQSPSKVMATEGHNASTGYAMGIVAGTPAATQAGKDLAAKTVAAAAASAKQQAATAKAFATSLANYIASTSEFVTTTLSSDLLSTPHAIRSGAHGLDYRLATGDRRGFVSSRERGQLDREVTISSHALIELSRKIKETTSEFDKAKSTLANLRQEAASVRSSTAAGFTGLGDPSQFGAVSSGAGLLQVLGRQVGVGAGFAASLATLRHEHLNKAVYEELATEGPQDAQQAALLASLTPAQLAQFNRDESTLQKQGRQAGSSSANYLFGKAINEQVKEVRGLREDLRRERREQHTIDRELVSVLKQQLRGEHADLTKLIDAVDAVGPKFGKALHHTAASTKQHRRAAVAGAHG